MRLDSEDIGKTRGGKNAFKFDGINENDENKCPVVNF